MSQILETTTTIANGADVSGAIESLGGGAHLVGVLFPDTMTNTTLTIQAQIGGAWRNVFDDIGVAATITVVNGLAIFPPWIAYGFSGRVTAERRIERGRSAHVTHPIAGGVT
jgi:hypothetical protein